MSSDWTNNALTFHRRASGVHRSIAKHHQSLSDYWGRGGTRARSLADAHKALAAEHTALADLHSQCGGAGHGDADRPHLNYPITERTSEAYTAAVGVSDLTKRLIGNLDDLRDFNL